MAGHARYTALLDACVLYPIAIADSLMSLATTGLFSAKWSKRIEEEWIGSLEANRPDLLRLQEECKAGLAERVEKRVRRRKSLSALFRVTEVREIPLVSRAGLLPGELSTRYDPAEILVYFNSVACV